VHLINFSKNQLSEPQDLILKIHWD